MCTYTLLHTTAIQSFTVSNRCSKQDARSIFEGGGRTDARTNRGTHKAIATSTQYIPPIEGTKISDYEHNTKQQHNYNMYNKIGV